MKNTKLGLFGALVIAGGMFFAGCTDPCKDVVCVNGECVEGDCVCDAGYEGTDCGTALNAKFNGSYSLTETCSNSGAAGPYSVAIAPKSGTATDVTFVGLWEVPSNIVNGTVGTDGLAVTIERQQIMSGFDIEGSGTINADGTNLTLNYTIYATGSTTAADACTAVLTK